MVEPLVHACHRCRFDRPVIPWISASSTERSQERAVKPKKFLQTNTNDAMVVGAGQPARFFPQPDWHIEPLKRSLLPSFAIACGSCRLVRVTTSPE
jgi:hypothetical protein